ncbi:MAG: class II aldolase/adducin family protein, partial [Acidimicrobiia bacterium]|nr:class II aldolase/adducin family protein [Acidimicrobiia bacterium]
MTSEIDRLKAEVAATARMMATARLVEGFGHASARLAGGGFLMTSTSPLLSHTAEEILTVDDEGNAIDAPAGKPLEIVIHAGIYRARPDVGAICRGHGAAMAAWGVRGEPVPLLHGMGGLAGKTVPVHHDLALITTLESGDRMAATLEDNKSMLLLANGGVAVG